MPETVPRLLVVITGIVAVLATVVGVRDYVGRKETAKPPASASSTTVAQSIPGTVRRKTASAKTRRARMSATEANTPAGLAATDTEKPIISEESAKHDVVHDTPKNVRVQLAHYEVNAALLLACLPLPNSTKPGDVDATYYQDWAREYGCRVE
jgi:hypothetical protein